MQVSVSAVMRLAPVCILAGALLLPATAVGKTYKLKGTVGGDANAIVRMKVVVKNGDPKRVKKFRWQGLDGSCDDTFAGEQSGTLNGTPSSSVKVVYGGNFRAAWSTPSWSANVYGKVRNHGRKIKGTIEYYFSNGFCNAPPLGKRNFTAKLP